MPGEKAALPICEMEVCVCLRLLGYSGVDISPGRCLGWPWWRCERRVEREMDAERRLQGGFTLWVL